MSVLNAVNAVSAGVMVPRDATITVAIAGNGYVGRAILEREKKGGWDELSAWTGAAVAVPFTHEGKATRFRLRATTYTSRQTVSFSGTPDGGNLRLTYAGSSAIVTAHDAATPAAAIQTALRLLSGLGSVTVTGTFAAGFVVTFVGLNSASLLVNATSTLTLTAAPVTVTIAEKTISYTLAVEANDATVEAVTTGAAAVEVDLAVYETRVKTGGTEGDEELTVGDGTGAYVGQRKLITLATLTHADDVVVLDHANIVSADAAELDAATIDAEGGFVLLEWNGTKWQVLYSGDATITED